MTEHVMMWSILSIAILDGIIVVAAAFVILYIMNKRSIFIHNTHENNSIEIYNELLKRIDYLNKWQRLLAKMIRDDRKKLYDHDTRVAGISVKIDEIARKVHAHSPVE